MSVLVANTPLLAATLHCLVKKGYSDTHGVNIILSANRCGCSGTQVLLSFPEISKQIRAEADVRFCQVKARNDAASTQHRTPIRLPSIHNANNVT